VGETRLTAQQTVPPALSAIPLADHAVRQPNLRTILVMTDALLACAAWGLALTLAMVTSASNAQTRLQLAAVLVGAVAVILGVLTAGKLYRARVCAVRAVETFRVGRAAVASGIVVLVLEGLWGMGVETWAALAGTVLSFALLFMGRATYRAWLAGRRRRGESMRPVALIGTNAEAVSLHRLLEEHPEYGYAPMGVIGEPAFMNGQFNGTPWLGTLDDIDRALDESGATGVLVAVSALESGELNDVVRRLSERRVHVHLSSGLLGIAHHRLRPAPLAHEPLFYLEHWTLARWQVVTKRGLDVMLGALLMLLSLPLMLGTAAAIKVQDGGPVFFRQKRVGRNGEEFTLYKFRTMVVDAEAQAAALVGQNQRGGPLFKMADDPRVTPLGRFLRTSSIDELPQLLNVLRGEMSLVGPRPALPKEAHQFDERLLTRTQVQPGITGLWQVEARDKPSFWAYRRLDLFYVENWSVGLDLAILFSTAGVVLGRCARALGIVRERAKAGEAIVLD
jgi:exopolysaccharide biosynthesis polyprenyl glycosylphosphotransferase